MHQLNLTKLLKGREDATKESDFTYDDEGEEDDEENDWDGEVEWTEGDELEGAAEGDVPDESAAYLDFLNQEVSQIVDFGFERITLTVFSRHRSSAPLLTTMMTSLMRKVCLRRHWTRLNHTACSSMCSWVC